MVVDGGAAGLLPRDGDPGGVAAERLDVLSDPLQGGDLMLGHEKSYRVVRYISLTLHIDLVCSIICPCPLLLGQKKSVRTRMMNGQSGKISQLKSTKSSLNTPLAPCTWMLR